MMRYNVFIVKETDYARDYYIRFVGSNVMIVG